MDQAEYTDNSYMEMTGTSMVDVQFCLGFFVRSLFSDYFLCPLIEIAKITLTQIIDFVPFFFFVFSSFLCL
jgi:hypothetical protein